MGGRMDAAAFCRPHAGVGDAGHVHCLDRLAPFMVMTHTGRVMPDSHAQTLTALGKGSPVAARKALLKELRAAAKKILAHVLV